MADFLSRILNKFQNYDDGMEADYVEEAPELTFEEPDGNPAPRAPRAAATSVDFKQGAGQQVVVVKPDSMESAQLISNNLRSGRTVICNFEQVDQKVAQRVVDFITGASYALDGKVHAVSSLIFVIVPRNVTIMNERDQRDYNANNYNRRAYGM